ncbi:CcdB family protein [Ochrobactrum teleogrylli]|uniref:Toxin CcdB n=1 Tax=Ochrobactrum teleogrylli TaxID=2479765 RepID=A0ABD5K0T6_9HYPH
MARYDVYPNPGGGYVLDVQADLLDELKTRIVIPLIHKTFAPIPAKRLNPIYEIEGEEHVLVRCCHVNWATVACLTVWA